MTYHQWAMKHCQTFGLFDPQEVDMVLSWESPLCAAAGFTVTELQSATSWMASQAAPKFRTEHLRMIQQRITGERLARAAREQQERLEAAKDGGTCVKCFNGGLVVVPHLVSVTNGAWVYPWYTNGVYCTCRLGRFILAGHRTKQQAMIAEADAKRHSRPRSIVGLSLEEYELVNPLWQGQVEEREKARREMHKAQDSAQAADRKRGPLQLSKQELEKLWKQGE